MIFKFIVGLSSVISTVSLVRLCNITEEILVRSIIKRSNGI